MAIIERFQNAWNAFRAAEKQQGARDPTQVVVQQLGNGSSYNPSAPKRWRGSEQSIKSTVINRIALDVAAIPMFHAVVDEEGNYLYKVNDELNKRLTLYANKDQTSRAFMQDVVTTMLEEGAVAILPMDTSENIRYSSNYKIWSWRCGKILAWYPDWIRVQVYNDQTGHYGELMVEKRNASIIQNPFYMVMNEPNFALQKLSNKMKMDDMLDSKAGSNKLDMIIQLPYGVSNEKRKEMARERKKDIEQQLSTSQYGIAYMDVNEKIIQLNRSVENQLQGSIEYYENRFYTMTGLSKAVIDGTANETEMNNYFNRCIEPIISAIADALKITFLTKTAITGGHTIKFFRDPFKLMSIDQLAELGDKLIRNRILSSNEMRGILGFKPDDNPKSDELSNPNMPDPNPESMPQEGEEVMNPEFEGEEGIPEEEYEESP